MSDLHRFYRVSRKRGSKRRSFQEEEPYLAASVVVKKKSAVLKLPPKYAMLEAFYEGVEAAISLLGIRRQLCTFQAVCATVEATTQRRFLLSHLAQIKHILPEAVQLEYVRSYDADTRNKKWELRISLLPLPAEEEVSELPEGERLKKKPKVDTVQRRRAFHARLVKFASTHPKEDVPEDPLPERPFSGNPTSTASRTYPGGVSSPEFTMPTATTCVPLEINTTAHRHELPESKILPARSTHFSSSFAPAFSSKAAYTSARFTSPDLPVLALHDRSMELSPLDSGDEIETGLPDSILPLPINRTSHRDVHNLAEAPLGSPHFLPSFRPFFSIKPSLHHRLEPELEFESSDDVTDINDMVSPLVNLTPSNRRRKAQEEADIPVPAELLTPIKVIRTGGASKTSDLADLENSCGSPHFSPSFKPHFSAKHGSSSPQNEAVAADGSFGLLSTPVKSSLSRELINSPYVRTPGQTSMEADLDSPICNSGCVNLNTPIKSGIPADGFRTPSAKTPTQYDTSPFTPLNGPACSENVTHCATISQSASVNSPLLTPVKQLSSMRSLKFSTTPKAKSSGPLSPHPKTPIQSGMAKTAVLSSRSGSPGVSIPMTPGIEIPVNPLRPSRFKGGHSIKRRKLNLDSRFAQNSEDEKCFSDDEFPAPPVEEVDNCGGRQAGAVDASLAPRDTDAAEPRVLKKALSFASSMVVAETRDFRKSLSFAMGDVSKADMDLLQSLPAAFVHSVMDEEIKVSAEQSKEFVEMRRKQQMMAGLPQLFNQLRLIFQSSKRSVYPYKELLSKVLSTNNDMTDQGEVEERMKMMVELAPDWISVNPSIAGDLLYRINKNVDVMSVRKRLCGTQ